MTNPFAPTAPAPQAPPAQTGNPFAAPAASPQTFGQPGAQGSSAWPAGAAPAAQRPVPALPTSLPSSAAAPPPPAGGGGQGANLVAMYGRLVLVFPRSIERNVPSRKFTHPTGHPQAGQPVVQDRLTATFVVLDGDNPIAFGGDPYSLPPTPHTKSEPLPHVSRDLWISQAKLIAQCSEQLAVAQSGGVGMVLGRVSKEGPERNAAWILTPADARDTEIANWYLAAVGRGEYPNPLA